MKDYNLISKIYDLTYDQLMGLAVQVREHPETTTDLAAQRDALEAVLGMRFADRKAIYDYYYSKKHWHRIRNKDDVQYAYQVLHWMRENELRYDAGLEISIKCALRRFTNAPLDESRRIVRDEGIDGYISLEKIPGAETREDAEAYFEAHMELTCRPSAYDCTGQFFTVWRKLFQRAGSWWCYHRVAVDC